MSEEHVHASHPDIIKRLKRAGGHMKKVVGMLEAEEPCVDIARQLHAVYKAVYNAKQVLIRDHIEHCLDIQAIEIRDASKIKADLAEITKYL